MTKPDKTTPSDPLNNFSKNARYKYVYVMQFIAEFGFLRPIDVGNYIGGKNRHAAGRQVLESLCGHGLIKQFTLKNGQTAYELTRMGGQQCKAVFNLKKARYLHGETPATWRHDLLCWGVFYLFKRMAHQSGFFDIPNLNIKSEFARQAIKGRRVPDMIAVTGREFTFLEVENSKKSGPKLDVMLQPYVRLKMDRSGDDYYNQKDTIFCVPDALQPGDLNHFASIMNRLNRLGLPEHEQVEFIVLLLENGSVKDASQVKVSYNKFKRWKSSRRLTDNWPRWSKSIENNIEEFTRDLFK